MIITLIYLLQIERKKIGRLEIDSAGKKKINIFSIFRPLISEILK